MSDGTVKQSAMYRELGPDDLRVHPSQAFASDVLEGLSERPKRLSSRYLYDQRGSDLFQSIMALDEYYPTRCEGEILGVHSGSILACVGDLPLNVVDLGAGDGTKTEVLLRAATAAEMDATYVPIDISAHAMDGVTREMASKFPDMPIAGLVAEYMGALHWLNQPVDRRCNLVLFLGSNIGNFNKAQARRFLRQLWSALAPGDLLLVGFDLKKDIELLLAAYNDTKGVTAEFNLNLLARINSELDANFDLSAFRHYSTYDVFSGAMESYLVSMQRQVVSVGALHTKFEFDAWEPIHTEYSYKYLESDIATLASDTGFEVEQTFKDAKGWFADALLRVAK